MIEFLQALQPYQDLLERLKKHLPISGLALPRAARLFVLGALFRDLGQPILLLTDRTDRALKLFDELGFWLPNCEKMLFPEPAPLFYEQAAWGKSIRLDRLQVLSKLASNLIPGSTTPENPYIVVAPVRAVMTRTLPRRDFLRSSRIIKVNDQKSPDSLQRHWVEIGYQSENIVLEPGQFSRRGGILDVFPMNEPYPVRIEFFGDLIETLRSFDPSTQRTVETISQVFITPAKEVLPGYAKREDLLGQEITEFHLPLIHEQSASLLDYLPHQFLVIVDDLDIIRLVANEIEEQAVGFRMDCIQDGLLAEDFPIPYLTFSEVFDSLQRHFWFEFGRGTAEEIHPLASCFSPGPRFGGRIKLLMDYLEERVQKKQPIGLASRQAARLKDLWQERFQGIDAPESPVFYEASLSEGWVLENFEFLTDSEIFGYEKPKPPVRVRPSPESPEAVYSDLRVDDWVVHVDYGIGKFRGLVLRTLDGSEREFLLVEYESGDQLFVPVHQADRLTRYIGASGETPTPSRLGSQEWTNTKKKVKESVRQVAADLLDLYARRQLSVGHAFSPDTPWQRELEASFPYVETADQLKAISDVKKDMENKRPMDRLLCGDVGYGKTEVALRAAFKAVMDGKQTAVLVPTTVLAQQHYDTFRQRLAAFPVEVEMLSRFRSVKEQDRIIKDMQAGKIDIVIGTHRLLSSDVTFKDLGLVIIDEEQRFGVTHKEYLKKLRSEVDVLTLTATPIPRTLYMALTGVRDISSINTPPEERLPISTHIGPYSPRLVRQAIYRELERGGQVFFVHNRVQTIHAMESHLRSLVPEARIGIGHGQMPENQLEAVMEKFRRGEIDVLLCTSIIESGLDIPNANTLIVDRGDTFGLAQLYQLRGRVGRGAQRAYAYFFRHRRKAPTPEGLERLETIAENTQLGAGYSIAMRDLEMRGAGELLGTQQHGYISSVGFHLYTRLLAQAVRTLQQVSGEEIQFNEEAYKEVTMPVSVDLPLSIGIPSDYVADQNLRLRLYRRLANIQDERELFDLENEFADRFGPLPETVQNLFFQLRVKIRAEACGLSAIAIEGNQIVLRFPPLPEEVSSRNLPPIGFDARAGKNAYRLLLKENWMEDLLNALSTIIEMLNPNRRIAEV